MVVIVPSGMYLLSNTRRDEHEGDTYTASIPAMRPIIRLTSFSIKQHKPRILLTDHVTMPSVLYDHVHASVADIQLTLL